MARVVLTAPGKGAIKDIVSGVNSHLINQNDRLLAAASCTTNAIVPAMKAMNDEFGIEHGHMETVHAYTNDQNLTDNFHKKNRRGRGAPRSGWTAPGERPSLWTRRGAPASSGST